MDLLSLSVITYTVYSWNKLSCPRYAGSIYFYLHVIKCGNILIGPGMVCLGILMDFLTDCLWALFMEFFHVLLYSFSLVRAKICMFFVCDYEFFISIRCWTILFFCKWNWVLFPSYLIWYLEVRVQSTKTISISAKIGRLVATDKLLIFTLLSTY